MADRPPRHRHQARCHPILQVGGLGIERHEPPERSIVHRQVDDRPDRGVLAHDLAEKPKGEGVMHGNGAEHNTCPLCRRYLCVPEGRA
jgi:hypothetical protein